MNLLLGYSVSLFAQAKSDTTRRVSLAAIPIVNYNNTTGFALGALGQAFYDLDPTDTISPSSSTGLFGMYTTNHTYFAGAFQRFYINEDTWRIIFAAGIGNINFQYWQDLGFLGGAFIGFDTRATFAMIRFDRKVFQHFYAGLNAIYSDTETGFDMPDWIPDSIKSQETNMNNIGYQLSYDNRDHQINPYGGYNIEFKHTFFNHLFNSDHNFHNVKITYNHFYKLGNQQHIIATRITANISAGDVPFEGQNVVGQDDIRGYSSGKYRDNQVYALQAEYRWRFYKKFGMVGFFGIASAVEHISEIPKQELLPGGGIGIRYMMIPKELINVGVDVAKGKDDWGLYFRIGESFGR